MIPPHNSGSLQSISFNFAQLKGPRDMIFILMFSLKKVYFRADWLFWPKEDMPQ